MVYNVAGMLVETTILMEETMIKCACGDAACKNNLAFDENGKVLRVEKFDGDRCTGAELYLDANGLVALINEARLQLMTLTRQSLEQ